MEPEPDIYSPLHFAKGLFYLKKNLYKICSIISSIINSAEYQDLTGSNLAM